MAAARTSIVAAALPIAFLAVTTITFDRFNGEVPGPYMDEIFHIPQALRYCRDEWRHYDPKLTTPPGLYVTSVGLARLLHAIAPLLPALLPSSWKEKPPCGTTFQLRATNIAAILLLPWLLASYRLATSSENRKAATGTRQTFTPISPTTAVTAARSDPSRAAASARRSIVSRATYVQQRRRSGLLGDLRGIVEQVTEDSALCVEVHTVALLPPLYFFSFLYYTDVLSTLMVVAMLSAARMDRMWTAALLGGVALAMRQTNIIWLLFALGTAMLRRLSALGLNAEPLYVFLSPVDAVRSIVLSIPKLPLQATIKTIAGVMAPFLPVIVLSGLFILWNDGIVLGDKEHHVAALHWAQACYLVAFATLFAWPTLISTFARTSNPIRATKSIAKDFMSFWAICEMAVLTLAVLAAIRAGTLSHPFLLADNRHYAFYLWRRLINRTPASRYLLAPLYAFAARLWATCLGRSQSLLWILGFFVCCLATVVPSPLIEPRYYILPYLIARMQIEEGKGDVSVDSSEDVSSRRPEDNVRRRAKTPSPALLAEMAWMIVINAVTIYLFLQKPFKWPHSDEQQRFMW